MGAWLIVSFSWQEKKPIATSAFPPCLLLTQHKHQGDASIQEHPVQMVEFRLSTQKWHNEQTVQRLVLIRMKWRFSKTVISKSNTKYKGPGPLGARVFWSCIFP